MTTERVRMCDRMAYLSMPAMLWAVQCSFELPPAHWVMTHVDRDVAVTPQQLTCSDRG